MYFSIRPSFSRYHLFVVFVSFPVVGCVLILASLLSLFDIDFRLAGHYHTLDGRFWIVYVLNMYAMYQI